MNRSLASGFLLALASLGCSADYGTAPVGSTQQAVKKSGHGCMKAGLSPLAQAACASGRLVGAAAAPAAISANPEYASALANEFNYVTPENATKWGSLQRDDTDSWDFAEADELVAFAKANHQKIKGHALIWHQQLPNFVTADLSKKQLKKLVRKHIKRVVHRYDDDISAWDVVNEAVADDGTLRQSVFLDVLGPDYIAFAFKKAAAHSKKKTDLLYNDYGIITANAKSDGVYALLSELIANRVPIDGIGFQGHIDARYAPSTEDMVANFQRFADLGLKVNISELDVRVAGIAGSSSDRLAVQQQIYHRVAAACAQVEACNALTVWGVGDAYSWIDGVFGADDPLLLDENLARKPAYRGVVDGLLGLVPDAAGVAPNLASSGSFESDAAGWFGFGTPSVELSASANTGAQALLGNGRTSSWQGPALILTQLVRPGFEYSASAFVKLSGADADVQMSLKTTCDGDTSYSGIGTVAAGSAGYSAVSGTFAIPYCNLSEATLYFQGPAGGVDILVDDVVVRQTAEPLGPELVGNGTFESGVGGWFGFGPPTIVPTDDARTGTGALLASGRTASWQGAATSLTSAVTMGATYRVSAFAKVGEGASSSDLRLTVKANCDGSESYTTVGAVMAESGVWTELTGSYQVPLCSNLSEVTLYAEGPAAGVDIVLDDVSVAQRLAVPVLLPPDDPNVVANGDFEAGSNGWYTWSGSMSVSNARAHSGSQSLVVGGPSLGLAATDLSSAMTPGETYNLSYWVTIDGADSAKLHVTRAMNCGSGTGWSWVTGEVTVSSGVWSQLTGAFTVPAGCTMDKMELYVEGGSVVGAGPAINLYVDDVVIAPPTNLVPNGDFETDASGWYSWNGAVGTSGAQAHSGSQSLLVSGTGIGPAASDFKTILQPGQTYSLSYWVLLEGADSGAAHVTNATDCGSGVQYSWVTGNQTMAAGVWTELSGSFSVPSDCNMAKLELFVEGGSLVNPSATINLYVDDVVVGQ